MLPFVSITLNKETGSFTISSLNEENKVKALEEVSAFFDEYGVQDKSRLKIEYINVDPNLANNFDVRLKSRNSKIPFITQTDIENAANQTSLDKFNDIILYFTGNGFVSGMIYTVLSDNDPEFKKLFDEAKPSVRYSYSKASIMSTTIPVIVVTSYCEGLTKSLKKANIAYDIVDKRPKISKIFQDIIKFKDGFLIYDINYS